MKHIKKFNEEAWLPFSIARKEKEFNAESIRRRLKNEEDSKKEQLERDSKKIFDNGRLIKYIKSEILKKERKGSEYTEIKHDKFKTKNSEGRINNFLFEKIKEYFEELGFIVDLNIGQRFVSFNALERS